MQYVFLGKFQPPHVGHILSVATLARKYGNISLGITAGEPRHYSFEVVSSIFKEIFPDINTHAILGEIQSGTDNLDEMFENSQDVIFISGNEDVLNKLKSRGYKVEYEPRSRDNIYEGTKIRNTITYQPSQKRDIYRFKMIDISFLKPIELIFEAHYNELEKSITHDAEIRQPIIMCDMSGAVLDGSHRYAFLLKHGYRYAPVMAVNYGHESISVGNKIKHRFSYDDSKVLTKEEIVRVAYSGALLPPRTTRHFFPFPKKTWPVRLSNIERTSVNSIEHLLSKESINNQIEANKRYLEEIYEEYESILEYLSEQVSVRQYLMNQIKEMKR